MKYLFTFIMSLLIYLTDRKYYISEKLSFIVFDLISLNIQRLVNCNTLVFLMNHFLFTPKCFAIPIRNYNCYASNNLKS